ncbi:MAG: NADH:flavin oxidoreductase [Saprospiraceae bacterium]|nr:NADH:flavin oxidoreductase [Saprospiraceae bacterium]
MNIFTPFHFQSANITAKNRIVLAPMTNSQSNDDGTLGNDEYRWLVRRAKEGFGIIITCAANISEEGKGWEGELGIFDDKHIPGLKRLADGIHMYNSIGIVQIFHGGARSPESVTGKQPWSSTEHDMMIGNKSIAVRTGSTEDISAAIQAFTDAAVRAQKAGFDGVELHGAHGYLLHQFISSATNQRTDEWGGTFENRTRLIRTILKKIKVAVPKEFIVGVRLSPEDKYTFQGIDFDESLKLAQILAAEGADYIHVSPWDAKKRPEKYKEKDKALITYFREAVQPEIPIMVAGEIWSSADAETVLNLGTDFIALGRAAIGIPYWPTLAREPDFEPQHPPYSIQHLKDADLSDRFIQYMKRWKGFVEE